MQEGVALQSDVQASLLQGASEAVASATAEARIRVATCFIIMVSGGILFPRNEESFGKVELPASPTLEAERNIGRGRQAIAIAF